MALWLKVRRAVRGRSSSVASSVVNTPTIKLRSSTETFSGSCASQTSGGRGVLCAGLVVVGAVDSLLPEPLFVYLKERVGGAYGPNSMRKTFNSAFTFLTSGFITSSRNVQFFLNIKC